LSRTGRAIWYAAWLVLALAILLRTGGVVTGVLYGPGRAEYATVAAIGAAVVILALWPYRSRGDGWERDSDGGRDRLGRFNLIAGTVTAAVAAAGLLLPAAPTSAAEAACRGAPLRTASLLATTQAVGANARQGPGESFPQAFRFAGGCTVGFDGYCLGEPVASAFFKDWLDDRWLQVPRHRNWLHRPAALLSGEPDTDRFVAAAVVTAQSPPSALRPLGQDTCGSGETSLEPVRLTVTATGSAFALKAEANGAPDVGFALWLAAGDTTGRAFRQIAGGNLRSARWDPRITAASIEGITAVAVLAQPCLGPSVPADEELGDLRRFVLTPGGAVSPANDGPPLPSAIRQRLMRTACQSPP
jgi:hypothetical protein